MRYFKYKNTNQTIEKQALHEQYATLNREEKRQIRKQNALSHLGSGLFCIVSALCAGTLFYLIGRIPNSGLSWLDIFIWMAKGILYLVAGVASLLIGAVASSPLFTKVTDEKKQIKREILGRACEHLRVYYGAQEPCLVTKCYDSSDKAFKNHDVCLFFCMDELRITANLKGGFFHGDRDLGCYVFEKEEFFCKTVLYNELTATELCAGDTRFVLGKRALPFIKKYMEAENDANQS